jgi:exo-beta-1,3-glucanase (GH17 family)
MLSKPNARFFPSLPLFLGLTLCATFLWGLNTTKPARSQSLESTYPINIIPDQMVLTGDATSLANCVDATVCSWFNGTPTGTIMLGVDPSSPDTNEWQGGIATVEVFLPNIYTLTVVTLKLSWPDSDGKGLHSPDRNRTGAILLDSKNLWFKRTTDLSTFDDFFAAEHETIRATIVLTQSITHTLQISVSAHTAWDLSQIELTASPYPTMTNGIGYSPFRDCQYPGGDQLPSTLDIREDLFRLFHTSNAIRTYSATGVNAQIPALANAIGLPVYAGVWLDYPKSTMEQDNAEILSLIDLACTANLQGVIVGNEYYLRHRSDDGLDYLLQRIREVRNGIKNKCSRETPITTAEIDDLIFGWTGDPMILITGIQPEYQLILDEIDFVMVHNYPFWSGMPIEGAAEFTINRYKAMRSLVEQEYPGEDKWIIIGEAGWPSGGSPNDLALPSMENQRKYMLELLPLVEQEGVDFMYFDAFDELWKIEEPGLVGQHWGYSYSDRAAKHSFYGVLLPAEQLPSLPPPLTYTVFLPLISNLYTDVRRFPVYTEWPEGLDRFVPSGWMGDLEYIDFYACDRCDPHNGKMAIRASFLPASTPDWGGIYWQYPENNWGNIDDGVDLRWANKLTFWARSDTPNAEIQIIIGGIGYPVDYKGRADCAHPFMPYPDSVCPKITEWVKLTPTWEKYTIDLHKYPRDYSRVVGGFGWVAERPITFYLDDIVYEFDEEE